MTTRLYVDIETSGILQKKSGNKLYTVDNGEIIQLSYIYSAGSSIVAHGDIYFKCDRSYEPDAIEMAHGLSKRKVESMASGYFKDGCEGFMNLVELCDEIVGHNICFDLDTILTWSNDEDRYKINNKPYVCTMQNYFPWSFKRISAEKGGGTIDAWCSLSELISKLINCKALNLDECYNEYKTITKKKPTLHDAMFDVFMTFKCHQELLVLSNAD